jgi:hypothetical protein
MRFLRRSIAVLWCVAVLTSSLACGDDTEDRPQPEPDSGLDASDPDPPDAGEDASTPDAARPDAAMRDAEPPDEDSGYEDDASEPMYEDTAYYPVSDGATWVYRHMGGNDTWDEHVELSHVTHDGEAAFMLRDTVGPSGTRSETVLGRVGSQIARIYREEFRGIALQATASYDPGFVRFDHAWVERADGYTETLSYTRLERDADGAITADGERSHHYTIEDHDDTVEVPAGTFDECIRVRRSRVRETTAAPVEGDEDLFWFCPGIGKVKEEDQATLESEELVSCDIPDGACPD